MKLEGFGASSHLHPTRILPRSEDLPVPALDELITEGLVVREDIDIVSSRGRNHA